MSSIVKKTLGWILFLSPFVILFALASALEGSLFALAIFAFAAALMGIMSLGAKLIDG